MIISITFILTMFLLQSDDTFNLPQTCPSPASKAVYSAVDIGTSVFTEIIDKDSGEVTQYDFVMVTGTSYYDLIFGKSFFLPLL